MTDDGLCGSTDTDTGEPCQREAGWGTDRDSGPCIDHEDERPVLRKFTPQRREQIIGAASTGAFKTHIAQLAEISFNTLESWLEMGEKDDENGLDTDLADFYCNWQRARGAGAIKRLQNVDDEFVLERGYGYTRKQRHEMLVDDDADLDSGGEPTSEFVVVDDAEDDA